MPVFGDTESAVTAGPVPGTVHVPRDCQPPLLTPDALSAYRFTSFAPPNVDANDMPSVRVSVGPLSVAAVVPFSAMVHWLFCSVPPSPTVPGTHCVPASFSRNNVLLTRW